MVNRLEPYLQKAVTPVPAPASGQRRPSLGKEILLNLPFPLTLLLLGLLGPEGALRSCLAVSVGFLYVSEVRRCLSI